MADDNAPITGIEFRWVDRSRIPPEADPSTRNFATFSDDCLLAVSFVPIRAVAPKSGLSGEVGAEFRLLEEVAGRLADEGYDVDLVMAGSNWPRGELTAPGPTAFFIDPHSLYQLGHVIFQIFQHAEPVIDVISSADKAAELVQDLRHEVGKPKKGGSVQGATNAAKTALLEMLGKSADDFSLAVETAAESSRPGTYLVTIETPATERYELLVHHVGKGKYQLARMMRLRAG